MITKRRRERKVSLSLVRCICTDGFRFEFKLKASLNFKFSFDFRLSCKQTVGLKTSEAVKLLKQGVEQIYIARCNQLKPSLCSAQHCEWKPSAIEVEQNIHLG